MNWHTIVAVLRKELRETLRDHRTIAWLILAPACIFPAIAVGSAHVAFFGRRATITPYRVIASGDAAVALTSLTRTNLPTSPRTNVRVVILPDQANAVERVRRGDVDAAVYIRPSPEHGAPVAQVLYDQTRDRSTAAARVVRNALTVWRDTLISRRLVQARDFAPLPLEIARDSSIVTSTRRQLIFLGPLIPFYSDSSRPACYLLSGRRYDCRRAGAWHTRTATCCRGRPA